MEQESISQVQPSTSEVPLDWYREAFAPEKTKERPWADRTEAEVDRAVSMLGAHGDERVLDLACGTGRHSLELARRGFSVVGVDISAELLEIAEREAEMQANGQPVDASFIQADLRDLDFIDEFDIIFSLNDGAVGYFETEVENRRTFEIVARALRCGGGHLMQLPNVLYAEAHLPQKTWIEGSAMIELIDHRWDARTRYLEGSTTPILLGEVLTSVEPIPFRQRLYSVEELGEIYETVGMALENVFRGSGKPRPPKDNQYEVFVSGRKPS